MWCEQLHLVITALFGRKGTAQSNLADSAELAFFDPKNTLHCLRAPFGQEDTVQSLRAELCTETAGSLAIHVASEEGCNEIQGAHDAELIDTPFHAFARSELGHVGTEQKIGQLTILVGSTAFVKVHEFHRNRGRRRNDSQNRKPKSQYIRNTELTP
jgi:hypothetical protein